MAISRGLGLNSPIQIRQSRENFQALIARHGQWVRWMKQFPCTCINANNRADPNCDRCGGDGKRYEHPDTTIETDFARVVDPNVILLPDRFRAITIHEVWDTYGGAYEVTGQTGNRIEISGPRTPAEYEFLEVRFTHSFRRELSTTGFYLGRGVIDVPDLTIRTDSGGISSSIVEVTVGVTPTRVIDNRIYFVPPTPEPAIGTSYPLTVQVVDPIQIVFTDQNMRREDRKWLEQVGGDALAVFPAAYNISADDVLTPLVAETFVHNVISKSADDLDYVPDVYVRRLRGVSTETRDYQLSVDFEQWGRNRIRWIGDRPAANESMMVDYVISPTYIVIHERPNIRSSENQLLPRRVAVKLLAGRSRRDEF